MNFDVEGVLRADLFPERRGCEEGVSPVTTDLRTEVCKVCCNVGCEGADVHENLGWEFVDGCERVSHRSEDAGSFKEAFFGVDDLIRRESRTLDREETTEDFGGVLLREKYSNPCYSRWSLAPRVLGRVDTNELTNCFERMSRV